MRPAEERLLRGRFASLAGPDDGDWGDVEARVTRRGRRIAVVAAATVAALVAAGLAVGGDVVGLFAEHGKRVPLSSFSERDRELLVVSMCRRVDLSTRSGGAPRAVCLDGEPTVEEIANDGRRIHWRVRYPWGLTCLASGRVSGYHSAVFGDSRIGTLGCNAGDTKRKLVPTPKRPITSDVSMTASRIHPRPRLYSVSGLAGSGVASVGLVPKNGPVLKTEVRGHAYSFSSIPDRDWLAIAAYGVGGKEVYREPLLGLRTAELPPTRAGHVWSPLPPARPKEPPLQHAATAVASADVYRNGVALVTFSSTSSDEYRRLVRTSRRSSDTAGVECGRVAFGAGRWNGLAGGANAHVGREMGMRVSTAHGGMPSPPYDFCEVYGTYGRYWNDEEGTHELAEVPLTPIGRRYLDERATARDLAYFVRTRKMWRIRKAIHRGEAGPSAAELARLFGERVVPLARRDAAAPAGRVGVWTDRRAIVASERAPDGRRLFVTVQGVRIGANDIRDLSLVF